MGGGGGPSIFFVLMRVCSSPHAAGKFSTWAPGKIQIHGKRKTHMKIDRGAGYTEKPKNKSKNFAWDIPLSALIARETNSMLCSIFGMSNTFNPERQLQCCMQHAAVQTHGTFPFQIPRASMYDAFVWLMCMLATFGAEAHQITMALQSFLVVAQEIMERHGEALLRKTDLIIEHMQSVTVLCPCRHIGWGPRK